MENYFSRMAGGVLYKNTRFDDDNCGRIYRDENVRVYMEDNTPIQAVCRDFELFSLSCILYRNVCSKQLQEGRLLKTYQRRTIDLNGTHRGSWTYVL